VKRLLGAQIENHFVTFAESDKLADTYILELDEAHQPHKDVSQVEIQTHLTSHLPPILADLQQGHNQNVFVLRLIWTYQRGCTSQSLITFHFENLLLCALYD
jgi:hypothetical protein